MWLSCVVSQNIMNTTWIEKREPEAKRKPKKSIRLKWSNSLLVIFFNFEVLRRGKNKKTIWLQHDSEQLNYWHIYHMQWCDWIECVQCNQLASFSRPLRNHCTIFSVFSATSETSARSFSPGNLTKVFSFHAKCTDTPNRNDLNHAHRPTQTALDVLNGILHTYALVSSTITCRCHNKNIHDPPNSNRKVQMESKLVCCFSARRSLWGI